MKIKRKSKTSFKLLVLGVLLVQPLVVSNPNLAFADELPAEAMITSESSSGDVSGASDVSSPVVAPVESVAPAAITPVTTTYPYSKTFTISAYYSPLPCQQRYVSGSYERDIRINGNGVHGADGSDVYPGMIAAPKTYKFGTKMDIPGVGTVAVHDRGGAILSGNGVNSFDRLDIWMGYGDKGLRRALNWGMRTMDVVVYGPSETIAEQVSLSDYTPDEAKPNDCSQIVADGADSVSKSTTAVLVATTAITGSVISTTEAPKVKTDSFLDKSLKLGDTGSSVATLQLRLKDLNLFKAEVTGNYGEMTKHAVFKFQQTQGLIDKETSSFAGVLGPKTRDRLNQLIASKNYTGVLVASASDDYSRVLVAKLEADKPKRSLISAELKLGMVGPEVATLQKFLKDLGFFDGALITQYYGPTTLKAVLKFQKAHNIIKSDTEASAGKVGPETLNLINTLS